MEKEFFDATQDDNDKKLTNNTNLKPEDINIARAKADAHRRTKQMLNDTELKKQKKKNFISICILSVGSISVFFILAIVFALFLHWYAVGLGFAIISIILSQVWIKIFKKLNQDPMLEHLDDTEVPVNFAYQSTNKTKEIKCKSATNTIIKSDKTKNNTNIRNDK